MHVRSVPRSCGSTRMRCGSWLSEFIADKRHDFREVAIKNAVEVVPGLVDAVIGEAILRKIVGSDFF